MTAYLGSVYQWRVALVMDLDVSSAEYVAAAQDDFFVQELWNEYQT
jgi:hypothetical protein